MGEYKIENLTFAYPGRENNALDNINLEINQGEFVAVAGLSGCGKTTLLKHLKPVLTPHGRRNGEIYFEGIALSKLSQREQSAEIGFVMQNPDNQIVTDKVWHELAFGLESLGLDRQTIRLRVAEMASFFGIQDWFHRGVAELSGGQKQLLNLASIMAMQPSVLILDEPTSQLDPIAASEFLAAVGRINRELGVTVIMTEHRLEEVFPLADRVIFMHRGGIVADDTPRRVGLSLRECGMFAAMPAAMRVWAALSDEPCEVPVSVRDGRNWLSGYAENHPVNSVTPTVGAAIGRPKNQTPHRRYVTDAQCAPLQKIPAVELKDVYFKYNNNSQDIIKGLSLKAYSGEFFAVLGGNGTGKTTMLSLIANINQPYRGSIKINGEDISKIENSRLFDNLLGVLPQNPQSLFVKKTVREDLLEMLSESKIIKEEKVEQVNNIAELCRISELLDFHPYDLSGGEQQRASLAKVLLLRPRILLLDEPTKGLDAEFKPVLADIINKLTNSGALVIMISHDIEFCAEYADRCALFFDGDIITEGTPRAFFSGNNFYTSSANRMARHILPEVVTVRDIITAFGGEPETRGDFDNNKFSHQHNSVGADSISALKPESSPDSTADMESAPTNKPKLSKLSKRTLAASLIILLAIPFTIYFGLYYLEGRRYYIISLIIILQTMLPFALIFEGRKPQARELVIIAVLCAIAVTGRIAFFMLPQLKPVVALVIIAGVAFGGESGFLIGAVTGFVSNMFFSQGPWMPYQMFAFGIIGFLAGVLFRKGLLKRGRVPLAIYGGLACFIIYGGIMNPASVLIWQGEITREMLVLAYLQGMPFDLVHAAATVIFMLIISQPMLEKLDRIKIKYGLVE